MKRLIFILVWILIIGCAIEEHNRPEVFAIKYAGFHIEKCIEDFGPPAFIHESQDGGYLYLWYKEDIQQFGGSSDIKQIWKDHYITTYSPPVNIKRSSTLTIWTDQNKIVKGYKIVNK